MKDNLENQCFLCDSFNNEERLKNKSDVDKYVAKLKKIGSGRYYRGEEYQLTEFDLFCCPECLTYFELSHNYYSDPESTMGLARDHSNWYDFERLDEEAKEERLKKLIS